MHHACELVDFVPKTVRRTRYCDRCSVAEFGPNQSVNLSCTQKRSSAWRKRSTPQQRPRSSLARCRLATFVPGLCWRSIVEIVTEDLQRIFDEGERRLNTGDLDGAEAAFLRVLTKTGDRPALCFNLGLIYKRRKDWARCADFNERTLVFSHEPGDSAWWNLGIAATALSTWETARRAWCGYGLPIDEGSGPIEADYGRTPVRINPDDSPEVLWMDCLDPARGRLVSIPFAQSGPRWGDVLLHDGAPNGQRIVDGHDLPVFDELERLVPSTVPILESRLTCATRRDSQAVMQLFGSSGA